MRLRAGCVLCPRCSGMGQIADDKVVGEAMRQSRMDHRLSVRELARRIGWSAAYVSDLERGLRTWTEEKKIRYWKGLK